MKEKKINVKEVITVTVSLLLICVITTALLAFVSGVTEKPIAENNKIAQNAAMLNVLSDASEFRAIRENVVYEALGEDGGVIGYAVKTSADGYGGKVSVMTGISRDGEIIKVAVVSASDETPGLGLNVKKEDFLIQFSGREVPLVLVNASSSTGANNEIHAVTSATYSSRAVVNAVNEAIEIFKEATGGEA